MKLLTVSVLLFALLALSCAADSQEETATQEPQAEEAAPEAVEEESEGATAAPEEEAKEEEQVEGEEQVEEEPESDADTSEPSHVVKRATSCPSGWTLYRSRCFRYFSYSYTWAQAENYCRAQGGNLATAPTNSEYDWLRSFIYSQANTYRLSWIGGSDSQQDRIWFWSDGSRFQFNDWCNSGPPSSGTYNCLAVNYPISSCYCGIARPCNYRYPFVCAKN
ncbi:galactose-specific lectin nattectin-like [Poecilia formosa]|nr:PREDICTED: galactose-specific lectin nattectin-like [Poecilia formosa]